MSRAVTTSARLAVLAATVVLGVAVVAPGAAQGDLTTPVEVRVWQHVEDGHDIYVSARPGGGSWRTLGTVELALDDGFSSSGRYRYGDVALDVEVRDRSWSVTVEIRVWQDVRNARNIHVSARGSMGSWATLGTIPLGLDDGISSNLQFRYGDIRLEVPVSLEGVTTLAGRAMAGLTSIWGHRDSTAAGVEFRRYSTSGLAIDRHGNVFVADTGNHAIRRIAPDGTSTTVAGSNGEGYVDGPREVARFQWPIGVAVAGDGTIYVTDQGRIRKVDPDGLVTTVVSRDDQPSVDAARDGPAGEAVLGHVLAVALDNFDDLYFIEQYRILRLSPSGYVSLVAGGPAPRYVDGSLHEASFRSLSDITLDDAGNIYVLETGTFGPGFEPFAAVRKVDTEGFVSTLYRSAHSGLGGALSDPSGIAVSSEGVVYVSNKERHQIVRLTPGGELEGVAGTGEAGSLDGPHGEAKFDRPGDLALGADGTLYVSDQKGSVIRRVSTGGAAVPVAQPETLPYIEGVSVNSFSGPAEGCQPLGRCPYGLVDGPAGEARFYHPMGLALEADGSVLVADSENHAIRRVAPDGSVSTVLGGNREGAPNTTSDGDGLFRPIVVAAGPDGAFFVVEGDHGDHRVLKVAPDGTVSTVEGVTTAQYPRPSWVTVDADGNLYVYDSFRAAIRRVTPEGNVSLLGSRVRHGDIAADAEGLYYWSLGSRPNSVTLEKAVEGSPNRVLFEDQGPYGALFLMPNYMAVAPDGSLYITDRSFSWVLRITPEGEAAIVVDRNGAVGQYFSPRGIVVLPNGDVLVADRASHHIWKITLPAE